MPQFLLSDWGLPSPHWRTVWALLTSGRVAPTPSNSALRYVPERTEARDSNKLRGKQPKGPSTGEGITKAWRSHMVECYSVTEKEVLIVVTTRTQVVFAQDRECAQHHWIHSSVVNFMSWQPYLNVKKILSGLGQCPPPPPRELSSRSLSFVTPSTPLPHRLGSPFHCLERKQSRPSSSYRPDSHTFTRETLLDRHQRCGCEEVSPHLCPVGLTSCPREDCPREGCGGR